MGDDAVFGAEGKPAGEAVEGLNPVGDRGDGLPQGTDVLVSIDGAGASHDVIDYLTSLNTAAAHGHRGRRVEYTIGWPVDERTVAAIEQLRESDWGAAVHADGDVDPAAQVADLTGIMRHSPGATGWRPGRGACG